MRQCGRAPLCSQTWVPRRSTGKGASTPEKHLALSSPVSELNAVGAVLMAAPSGQAESPVCKFGGNLNIRLVRHKLFFLNFQHLEPTPNFWDGGEQPHTRLQGDGSDRGAHSGGHSTGDRGVLKAMG